MKDYPKPESGKFLASLVMLFLSFAVQAQDYEGYIGGHFMLVNAMDSEKGYCLDLEGHARHINFEAPVIVHACK